MPDILDRARAQALDNGIGLDEAGVLDVLRLPDDRLPAALQLAHEVRMRWCGPEVEVEGIVSLKTGGCPEDCHFCSQSGLFASPVRAVWLDIPTQGGAARTVRSRGKIPESSGGFLESGPGPRPVEFDAAEDHGQLRRRDGEFPGFGAGEGEGPLLQSAEVQGEAVAHPSRDFEFVAAAVLEDEEVARGGYATFDTRTPSSGDLEEMYGAPAADPSR